MLPDRVSNPGPLTRGRCPTDCATRPSCLSSSTLLVYFVQDLSRPSMSQEKIDKVSESETPADFIVSQQENDLWERQ